MAKNSAKQRVYEGVLDVLNAAKDRLDGAYVETPDKNVHNDVSDNLCVDFEGSIKHKIFWEEVRKYEYI